MIGVRFGRSGREGHALRAPSAVRSAPQLALVGLLALLTLLGSSGLGGTGTPPAPALSAPTPALSSHVPVQASSPEGSGPSPSLSLNTTAAPVGAWVTATGSGFPPNSTANFTLDGYQMSAACSTAPNGSLQGPGAAPCQARVPASPGGRTLVAASTGGTAYGDALSVRGDPSALAYDPTDDRLFVTDGANARVDVLDASNFTLAGTVPVGRTPVALAYDPLVGQVFVANQGSDNVTVLDARTDSVVANVTVGSTPVTLAVSVDGNTSRVFVGDYASGSIDVLNASNDSLFATIGVGTGPVSVAFSPSADQVWVANFASSNLSVVDAANLTVDRSVPVASNPSALVVDPNAGEVFVAFGDTNKLAVVSLSTDSVDGNISLPDPFPSRLAVDPAQREVFVLYGYSEVGFVSDVTNTLLWSTNLVGTSGGITFDPTEGYAVVSNEYVGTLVRVLPATYAVAPLRVVSTIEPPSLKDSGQTATFHAEGFASTQEITQFSLGGRGLNCTQALVGTCVLGALWTAANGSLAASFVVPAVPSSGDYSLELRDATGLTAEANVSVNPAPLVGPPRASPAVIDLGQSVLFSLPVAYGQAPYNFTWQGLPRGCRSQAANFTCQPTRAGNYSVSATAEDALGDVVESTPLGFTVDTAPTIGVINASSPWLSLGQPVTFSVAFQGGAPPYQLAWVGVPTGCPTTGDPLVCTPTAPGATTLYAVLTDGNGELVSSPGHYFTVDQYPIVVSANLTATSIDLGGDVTFRATASEGAGSYQYLWFDMPSGCADDAAVVACTPSAPGTFSVSVGVTDANGFTVYSTPLPFRVFADPTVRVTIDRPTLDVGETADLTAVPTNGSGDYTFAWSGLPQGCGGSGNILPCDPQEGGIFDVVAVVTDSQGVSARSAPAVLTVWAALAANLTLFPATPEVGVVTEMSLRYSGGGPPITAEWELPGVGPETGSVVNYTFTSPGRQFVTVLLNDSTGASVQLVFPVEVAGSGGAAPPASGWIDAGILAGLALGVVLGVVLALRRRRPRRPAVAPGPVEGSAGQTLYGVAASDPAAERGPLGPT